jgi:hypothetical protein
VSRHRNIRLSLYDYLEGTLDEKHRTSVESHLTSCRTCAEDLRRLQETLSLVARPERPASNARSEEFWATFSTVLERRIEDRKLKKTPLADLWDTLHSYLFFRRRSFALAGSAVALVVLMIVVMNRPTPTREYVFVDSAGSRSVPLESRNKTAEKEASPADNLSQPAYTATALEAPLRMRYADTRMSQYLRKSKVLLIGIANLKTDDGQPVDLRVEQRASRELVKEARYLKQRPLNPRVDELVDAMSRILIEMANITEDKQIPNMEIVRSGIHQENLLFKIRMAEALFDPAHVVYAKGTRQ